MRTIYTTIAAFCCTITTVVAQPVVTAGMPVTSVKLYPGGAQLTMSDTGVKLPKGFSLVEIDGLPDNIVESTIQASVGSSSGVKILSVSKHQDMETPGTLQLKATKALDKKIEAVEDSIKQTATKLSALEKQLDALDLYKMLGYEKTLTLEQIRQAGEFVHNQTISFKNRQQESNKLTDQLKERKGVLVAERKTLTEKYLRNHSTISCLVESAQPVTVPFKVTYFTPSARWSIGYDLKVPQDLTATAKLTTGAKIVHSTGLDWKDVKITLSTSDPNRSSQYIPTVNPQYLSLQNVQDQEVEITRFGGTYTGEAAMAVMEDVAAIPVANMTQGVNSREYEVSIPYSISSGIQKGLQITLEEQEIPVSYEYLAVLENEGRVMLTTIIDSVGQYQLANSVAAIYLGGTYLGNRSIGKRDVNANNRLVLSLGEDPMIVAKRQKIVTKADKGNSSIDKYKCQIALRNNKSKEITVKVIDRHPISNDTNIKVNNINYNAGATADDKGIVTWLVPVPAKADANLTLEYDVSYPKDRQLQ